MEPPGRSSVYVIETGDRPEGVRKLLDRFDMSVFRDLRVALKANYNSADPFPATTHLLTLAAVIGGLKRNRANSITLAERSGMGITGEVLQDLGVAGLAAEEGVDVDVLDDRRSPEDWVRYQADHWQRGYLFSRAFEDADEIVETCCLKTHRFGGHFTLALKNSVGMVARFDPDDGYDYMGELHTSVHQREMIAEINAAYSPAIVVMDATKGFSHGGPEKGTTIEPGLMLASDDRIAIDACGVAILRSYGTTPEVSKGDIFSLPQIRRAAELGLGAAGPKEIEIVPVNEGARDVVKVIERELRGATMVRTT